MPSAVHRNKLLDTSLDEYDEKEEEPSATEVFYECNANPIDKPNGPILHHICDNPGLDTTQLTFPKYIEAETMGKRLKLDTEPLEMNEDIPSFPRKGKKKYAEINYKQNYKPKEYVPPHIEPEIPQNTPPPNKKNPKLTV